METNINKLLDLVNETCCELTEGLKPKKADLVRDSAFEMTRILLTEIFGEEAIQDAVKIKINDIEKNLKEAVSELLGIDPGCIQTEGPIDLDSVEIEKTGNIHVEAAKDDEKAAEDELAEDELINELTQIVKSMKPGQKAMLTITKGNHPRKMPKFEA